ncbi:hypothetical protein L7F22_055501 [Adiantum nelumboides]|nr:hypothetical protein [Adiantum nelumboides]
MRHALEMMGVGRRLKGRRNRDEGGQEGDDVCEEVVGIRVQALDEVVSVNSFFTAAVFIGLAQSNDRSLVAKGPTDPCYASTHLLRQLILLEVLAFSCFLMSSLVAQGLKLHLILCRLCAKWSLPPATPQNSQLAGAHQPDQEAGCGHKPGEERTHSPALERPVLVQPPTLVYAHELSAGGRFPHQGCVRFLRLGVLATSIGSLCGTAFLLISIIIIIELRLGLLSCDSAWSKFAAIPLVLLVSFGVLVFASAVYVAFRS